MGNLGSEGSYGDFTGNLGKRHEKFDLWFRGCAVWNLLGVHPLETRRRFHSGEILHNNNHRHRRSWVLP